MSFDIQAFFVCCLRHGCRIQCYAGSRATQKICRLTSHVHSKIRTTDILNVVIGVSRRANTAMKAVAVDCLMTTHAHDGPIHRVRFSTEWKFFHSGSLPYIWSLPLQNRGDVDMS